MKKSNYAPIFNKKDLKIDSVTREFDGFFKIDKYCFVHALFAGGQSQLIEREIFERGHAVAVLPYDPIKNKVVLIEQLRIGALPTKDSPWLLEVIAGMVDKGQEKESVAIREAEEEAGLQINNLIPMLDYLSSPGGTTERLYLHLAIVDSTEVGGIYGLDHEGEDIKVHVFDYDDVMALLKNGVIDNAATVICLQWLALNKVNVDQDYANKS